MQDAMNLATNDKNDYIMVVPNDGNTALTPNGTAGQALVVNKARVHLLSVGFNNSALGYSNTIQGFATTAVQSTSLIQVNAPALEMAGFRVLGTNGTNANGSMSGGIVALGTASTGTAHNTWFHNMSIEGNNATGGANGTTRMIVLTEPVAGLRVDDSVIGNTVFHADSVTLDNNGARHEFKNVRFLTQAQATGDKFIVAGTGANGYALFERCQFINVAVGTAVASAVTGSISTSTPYLMSYNTYVNVTQAGTDPSVFKAPAESGTSTSVRDLGIAVGTAALIPA